MMNEMNGYLSTRKTIVVNYIAASTGGAYTILTQFLESVKNNIEAQEYNWIVFVSLKELEKYNSKHIQIVCKKSKNWIARILWDFFGIQAWLKKNKIEIHRICSLQNTGIPRIKAKQYVYLHQSLILAKHIKLKRFEYGLKIYRFIYWYSVKYSINQNSTIVVQTKGVKNELAKQFKINSNNIIVLNPKLNITKLSDINDRSSYSFKLFYPAVPHGSYKNHELLVKLLSEIKGLNKELYSKIKILITSVPDFNKVTKYCYDLSKKLNVDERINWCGYLNNEEINEAYLKSDIVVFPSKLESYPLPLIEAASRNKQIITLDNSFSHELIDGYKGVSYLDNCSLAWANNINDFYKKDFSENQIKDKFVLNTDSDKDIVKLFMQ
jgi:glycosyltransferase involved in cell wall biosynthesis